jgi:hypothetical protein
MRETIIKCDLCGDETDSTLDPDFCLLANVSGRVVARLSVDLCVECKRRGGLVSWVLDIDELKNNDGIRKVSAGKLSRG